ncbi:hypothetical protein [Bacillus sp. V5-8f]|nr:hypothetical protein [Bacillus sp. V5-8f]
MTEKDQQEAIIWIKNGQGWGFIGFEQVKTFWIYKKGPTISDLPG